MQGVDIMLLNNVSRLSAVLDLILRNLLSDSSFMTFLRSYAIIISGFRFNLIE